MHTIHHIGQIYEFQVNNSRNQGNHRVNRNNSQGTQRLIIVVLSVELAQA